MAGTRFSVYVPSTSLADEVLSQARLHNRSRSEYLIMLHNRDVSRSLLVSHTETPNVERRRAPHLVGGSTNGDQDRHTG